MKTQLITRAFLTQLIPERDQDSYKNQFGHVVLVGGNEQMGGAIQMAARGSVNAGAGLTTILSDKSNKTAIHTVLPEAMFMDWNLYFDTLVPHLNKATVIVIGPGFGLNPTRFDQYMMYLEETKESKIVVIDADALTQLAKDVDKYAKQLEKHQVILTPHLGEWQKLSQQQIADYDDRNIQHWVEKYDFHLVLKSHQTRIFIPQTDTILINTFGNPGMSIGGMGDTLAGILGGVTAQITHLSSAIPLAVGLHSLSADKIYETHYVVKPTEVSDYLPKLMNQLLD
ncbi:NAD(P)H-hydrate dehydratase [Aerococcus suis]